MTLTISGLIRLFLYTLVDVTGFLFLVHVLKVDPTLAAVGMIGANLNGVRIKIEDME